MPNLVRRYGEVAVWSEPATKAVRMGARCSMTTCWRRRSLTASSITRPPFNINIKGKGYRLREKKKAGLLGRRSIALADEPAEIQA